MKIKIAIIVLDYWGKKLAKYFFQLGALHSVCDSGTERLNQIKKEYKDVHTSSVYTDIFNDKDIRAIAISTPAETHFELAKEALLAGKDVFVEKPLALTVAEGMELVNLAEERKSILMVGHLLEYHPAIVKLKELISKGELGKIQYIYSNRLNLGKIRQEENILWSFAPHDISAILTLLNEFPESVSAHGGNCLHREIADVTMANLSFESGVKGHVFVSWLHPYKEQKLIVVGEKKMAVFDDLAEEDKLLLFNHKIEWIERLPVPKKEDAEIVKIDSLEPLQEECKHFLKCINTRQKPKTDGLSGVNVLKVIQACQNSLENDSNKVKLLSSNLENTEREEKKYFVHESAFVEKPCEIGEGTKIWHGSHIMQGAKIGKNCQLGQNVFIGSKAVIGNGVKVQNNVSVYDCVTLEDDVFCGPSMVFTNVINPRSHVPRKDEFKKTIIKKGATLGANATIICGISIGAYAFIGAGAVVTKDVPAHALVFGNPAKINGWMCCCGVKLKFSGNEGVCMECNKKYTKEKDYIL